MRALLLAFCVCAGAWAGCLGGDDAAPTAPPNPFPTQLGLRLTCADAVASLAACGVEVHPGPANELSIAVHPSDPDILIGGSKDYTLGEAAACGALRVWSAVYVSHDGGATWTHAVFPGHPGDPSGPLAGFECNTDPVLAFAPDGTAYYSGLAYGGPAADPGAAAPQKGSALWIARSDDGGLTWSEPAFVATSDGGAVFHDKQWFAVGPVGELIMTWTAFTGPPEPIPGELAGPLTTAQVLYSTSTDRGATWSAPRVLFEADTRTPTEPRAFELDKQFSTPVFDPDGNVYVSWLGYREGVIYLARGSAGAGGAYSFGAARAIIPVAPVPGTLPNSEFRAGTYPVLVADPSTPGVLAIVWSDHAEGNADILHSRSNDGGATWSSPRRINDDDTTHDQWMPWAQIDARGGLHVVWFDRRDDPANRLIDTYYAYAGGDTFQPNVRLTPASFDGDLGVHQSGNPFIGDYIGLAVASRQENLTDGGIRLAFDVRPFWPDTRSGTAAPYTSRLTVLAGRPGTV